MKFRGLLSAAVVLLILAGVLYWSGHRKPHESASSTASATPTIIKIDPANITLLTVKQKDAQPVALVRASGENWRITSPGQVPASSDAISGMLSALSPLTAERVVEDRATDLSRFGLTNPSLELDITGKNNQTSRLLLGDDTPTGDAVYVAVAGDPRVFTAPAYTKSSLNKSYSDLRDKRLVPLESSNVSAIDLTRKGQNISFARVQNGWQIEKPQTYRTDSYQVDDLLRQVTDAKWDPSATSADAAKAFAKATPVATIKVTGSDGADTVEVRKDHEDYYAKASAVSGIWKIDPAGASSLDQALERSLDDYRNKQLFDFGYTDPDKIEYHSGATSLVLTHSGTDWWSNGKKMDPDGVEGLVSALRDLAAAKFVDSGFTSPQIEVTVTSGGGKKVEQVQIQKTSDGGIARRTDGPSLYSLDSAALNGLISAVSGLKPAAPPKKK